MTVTRIRGESGFSLVELLIATTLLLIVSSIVTGAITQMTNSQRTIANRTEMHSGIRGATELLQQEVGQAGRISLPARITIVPAINPLGGAAPAAAATCDHGNPGNLAVTVQVLSDNPDVNAVSAMFAQSGANNAYELLTTMDGDAQESIKIASFNTGASTITACFLNPHLAGTVLVPLGAFATGIVPNTGFLNGSSDTMLKLYGDINGDGKMVYIEYTCDAAGTNNLYRNVMPYDTPFASKPLLTNAHVLLSNVVPNPIDPGTGVPTPCFTYQTIPLTVQGTVFTFVLDVAVTLTVETEQIDPITRQKQTETKALLNVSPRNVFNAWMLASIGYTERIQSTPTNITALVTP
jgi:prepilin-type N-terminal cleavage/methylation domain-containing protein